MNFGSSKLEATAFGVAIFTLAVLVQPVAADPIYHLRPGVQYTPGNGIGTFSIPTIAEGLLFQFNAYDPPTEITLTGLYPTFGEKVRCLAVTRSAFACSIEGATDAHYGDVDTRQSNGWGSGANGPVGSGANGDRNDDDWRASGRDSGTNGPVNGGLNGDDPIDHVLTELGDGSNLLFQTANLANDSPVGVPEPGSLLLLGSALLTFGAVARHKRRSNTVGL